MNAGLLKACVAEVLGTFILVFFGCGSVHSAVLLGGLVGLWQVGIVWGLAIMLAVYAVGAVSGAHLNPAVTIALAVRGRFDFSRVLPYIAAQFVGAFAAAAVLFGLFSGFIAAREAEKATTRGSAGSIVTAMCYGEYFPNPGGISTAPGHFVPADWEELSRLVSHPTAFCAEVLGTALLVLVIFATTDARNRGAPADRFAPVFIGLTVTALICVLAPLTQACFNPARDLGPRVFAYLAGWGSAALPGPNGIGFFTVYIVAPIVGAILGATVYDVVLADKSHRPSDDVG